MNINDCQSLWAFPCFPYAGSDSNQFPVYMTSQDLLVNLGPCSTASCTMATSIRSHSHHDYLGGGGTNDMSDWICRVAVKEFFPVVQVKAFNKAFSYYALAERPPETAHYRPQTKWLSYAANS
jgi:hypothetical protein